MTKRQIEIIKYLLDFGNSNTPKNITSIEIDAALDALLFELNKMWEQAER